MHHLWLSHFSPTSVLLSHGFGTTKWTHHYSKVLYTEGAEVTAAEEYVCCIMLRVGKSHVWNTLVDTRDIIHAVPKQTLSVLNSSLAVN